MNETSSKVQAYRLGVDIGGTFTDVVLTTESGGLAVRKILSTPEDYAEGVIAGARAALADLDIAASGSSEVVHATTVATNAILERAGARCALITTAGFRDVLEIGRLRIPELFNLFYDKRPVLVPRDCIFEVDERINHHGEVVTALAPKAIERAVEAVIASGAESVAVCLLNSYANPDHERAVAAALRARAPDLDVSVSAEILPRIGEFERTSTTAINAYVQPTVRRYIGSLAGLLGKNGIAGPLLIMQSGGGLMGAARAAREPVNMIESGPAAGVLAARHFIAGMGLKNAVTFDMGGTTAKASIIENGEFLKTTEYEVGGHMSATSRLTGGGGYPITVPAIDIAEVGAGGGSIVWLDSGGSLRVGPQSAGAAPGPVCYGAGGEQPTVTDANLILGYLNPARIAGGAIKVFPEPARAALEAKIARPLGLDLADAAYGVHLIANSEMIGAIRAVSTQRGRDVRDFALVAFGGCGPAHAAPLAREMGIATVVVPPSPGLFSAFGLLTTELEFQRTRTLYADAALLAQGTHLAEVLAALRVEIEEEFNREAGAAAFAFEISADMRYWGQSFELPITAPADLDSAALVATLVERFEAEHESTYGQRAENERVVIAAIRLVGRVPGAANGIGASGSHGAVEPEGSRDAWFGPDLGWVPSPVIGRGAVPSAGREGPLLIEEYDSVIVVPPGCSARGDPSGSIVLTIDDMTPGGQR
jgi:N-methylhydantoinase A